MSGAKQRLFLSIYEHLFVLTESRISLWSPRDNFTKCANRKLDWQSKTEVNTINLESVKELYEVEATHPPLVVIGL